VERSGRGKGIGTLLMKELISESRKACLWKLVSRVFVDNEASRTLLRSLGFREVGVYKKHGRLDGVWRDVVIVELLIPENIG
jgi:phosphinothricin acetyltransferase